jgi:3-deoxy-D-manno-octulosonic-acid transferase
MAWLLDFAYLVFLASVSPILAWRMLARGKYRTGWGEKLLGRVPPRTGERPCLWFHAVSVGEVLQLEPVLAGLRTCLPGVEIVISTTTPTGRSVAETKFPRDRVCYFPLDFSWAVREALRRLRPTAIVLVELELWPNFIQHANRQGIPLALINGRISQRSGQGYARIAPLFGRLLHCFETLAVQNGTYAQRLLTLGAPRNRVHVTGSIKFDRVATDSDNPQTAELRRYFGIGAGERVWIAGSTTAPEESYVLDAYESLRPQFPNLRLLVVPRHQERFEEVAALIRSRHLPLLRRSAPIKAPGRPSWGFDGGEPPVLLLDTLGELSACWGLAEIAFVGGSLSNRGGQNMIEPAGYGAAVLFGPNTWNFRDVVELLLSEGVARVVHDPADLTAAVAEYLADPAFARAQGRRAQELVTRQRGAAARTIKLLANLSCFAPSAQEARAA